MIFHSHRKMDTRSPLESIFGVIGSLPHDKPVKQAVYNAVALLLLLMCAAAALGLYWILEPFVKPLMWALLVGSALHPLKRSLRDRFQGWFQMLEDTNTPTVLGLVLLPVNIFNNVSDCIGQFLWNRIKIILAITILLPVAVLLYNFTPGIVVAILWTGTSWVFHSLNFIIIHSTLTLVVTLVLVYLTLVFFIWSPENNVQFHYASTVIWLLCSCCLSGLFYRFQMPVFIVLQIIFFGGFISEVYEAYSNMNAAGHKISFTELLSIAFHDKPIDLDISDEIEPNNLKSEPTDSESSKKESVESEKTSTPSVKFAPATGNGDTGTPPKVNNDDPWSLELFNDSNTSKPTVDSPESATGVLITNQGIHLVKTEGTAKKPRPTFQRSLSQPQFAPGRFRKSNLLHISRKISLKNSVQNLNETSYESSFYLYSVMWLCLVMLFWKNIILLPLLPLPILYYIIKHTGVYLGLWSYLSDKLSMLFDNVCEWCVDRHDALVPVPIRGLYKVMHKINATIKSSIKDSIDTVASCVVIFGLIVFLICASIFTALQIYAEGIMLVQMTSNVINQTVVQNPELRQMLPPTWDETMDSLLDNAYQYGREGISKAVKSVMNDADSIQSEKLERQILELWDRLYQSWMSAHNGSGPKVTEDAVKTSWEEFVSDLQKSPVTEIFNVNGIIDFGKQNVGMLMSLLESVWGIIIGNISLLIGSFSTCLSIVLGGGTAVLNFILNMIVFLTTLFYLLNSSGEYYKPVELMTKFSPSGKRFGHALEAAINSVFSASLKMAAFYGMWTWFIHNLFNVQIVYLSSAFATILGAVPFLGTYWACVPGILDLWLSQDRWIAAILFAGFQFLPTYIVDTTIYKEIKGGHPYLTGLAIAGGIFCMGVEGALIGPLLLCGLYVAIDLSSNLFKESPADDSMHLELN